MTYAPIPLLNVQLDMAGCPNRCRHCWLGAHPNGHMSKEDFQEVAADFRGWRDEQGCGIMELGFFSWWREPDFRDDYRELWALEQAFSSHGRAQRFELLSTWRLARDQSYAEWAVTLPPKVCQISFFGMEENTDWGMRRPGAFSDQLLATERCRAVGIEPRWQFFLTRRALGELDDFLRLIRTYRITNYFLITPSPEGAAWELEDLRLTSDDLAAIPTELIAGSRDGDALLGSPENALLPVLLKQDKPALLSPPPAIAIDALWNVYPNIAEPAPWWRLGNLKTDGVDHIIRAWRDAACLGMDMNLHMPVRMLAQRFGDPDSRKLYADNDLIVRFFHQYGAALSAEG